MRDWPKRDLVIGVALVMAAVFLVCRQSTPLPSEKSAPTRAGPRHSAKSMRVPESKGTDHIERASLTSWPSAEISGVYLKSGFVLLKPDTLTVAKGEIGYINGIARDKAWIRISSADDRFLIADLEGEGAALVRPGDRVTFSQRPVILTRKPTVNPREIRWTDADRPGDWMDR